MIFESVVRLSPLWLPRVPVASFGQHTSFPLVVWVLLGSVGCPGDELVAGVANSWCAMIPCYLRYSSYSTWFGCWSLHWVSHGSSDMAICGSAQFSVTDSFQPVLAHSFALEDTWIQWLGDFLIYSRIHCSYASMNMLKDSWVRHGWDLLDVSVRSVLGVISSCSVKVFVDAQFIIMALIRIAICNLAFRHDW